MKSFVFSIIPALFCISILVAQPQKITTVEGITEYRLENGLKFLLFPDPSKQTITVNVTYLVGSKHENYGETGMAHLLEHLLFKGTEKHPDLTDELTKRSPRANGTTWLDRTNYYETLTASEENLEWALEMEADRMVNSRVSAEDLKTEMTVVRNEFEAGENSPYGVLIKRILSTSFIWHNYGKSTIGARSDIENVSIDRLQAFYKTYYQPDNAVLIVAGKFDEAKSLELIEKYFGAIPKPSRALPAYYTADPTQDGERSVTLKRAGNTQLVGVSYHIPPGSHEDFAAIDIVTYTLGNTPSGRIYKAMVEPKLATRIFGFNYQLKEPGVMMFCAEALKHTDIENVKASLLATVDSISSNPPTEEEIERARQASLKSIEQAFNSSEQISIMLSNWIGMGDWKLFFLHRDRIENMDPSQVTEVATKYFKKDNRTVGIFIPTDNPERVVIPAAPNVDSLVKGYKGKEAIAMGEEFEPSVENIRSRLIESKLSNGMKIFLVPKKTRGGTIRMTLTLLNGEEESLSNLGEITGLTTSMLIRGSQDMNREEIQDTLNQLKSTVYFWGDDYYTAATIESDRKNFEAMLQVLAEMLKEPVFPQKEFESLVGERIAQVEYQRKEPNAIADRKLRRHLNPYPKGHIRYVSSFEEEINDINEASVDDIKAYYQKYLGSAHGVLTIVGDIDPDMVKDKLETLFGDWNSQVDFSQPVKELLAKEILYERVETPDKKNAFLMGAQEFPLSPDDPDFPALELGYYLLGHGFQSRLLSRLREKEGLSYGAGCQLNEHPITNIIMVRYYAIYAPENVDKLEEAFKDEIRKVSDEGYTREEVEEAKKSWKENRVVNIRSQDNSLARHLNLYGEWGRDIEWDARLEEKVSEVSVEEVNAAMKKYLDVDKIHLVLAGDFAK